MDMMAQVRTGLDLPWDLYASNQEFSKTQEVTTVTEPTESKKRVPRFYMASYSIAVTITVVFATLLVLSLLKIETIHPFLSLVGTLGGLSLAIPVLIDIREAKRKLGIG